MKREDFEQLVRQGIELIPERFRKLLKNVAILVSDEPTPVQVRKARVKPGTLLLGLYEGVPQNSRYGQTPVMPDTITIFQLPIEAVAKTPVAIRQQVASTVWHEIGHYFGLSEHAVQNAERRRRQH